MPILKREDDLYPAGLLDSDEAISDLSRDWWCIYTISRREKDLMRKLKTLGIGFFAPIIVKRTRSPKGRMRQSFIPLFPNYVFMLATESDRVQALKTNCISKQSKVTDREALVLDLKQIHQAIAVGEPLTPEAKLVAGQRVRVRSGPFRGYEGTVVRREGKTRLLLSVRYLEQGVSMEVDEGLLEPI